MIDSGDYSICIKSGKYNFNITFEICPMPGLCSSLIAFNLNCNDKYGWADVPYEHRKKLLDDLHDQIITISCKYEEHFLICTDNHSRPGATFKLLAEHKGYDYLPSYKSRLTGETCQVWGYEISREEKENFDGDPTSFF